MIFYSLIIAHSFNITFASNHIVTIKVIIFYLLSFLSFFIDESTFFIIITNIIWTTLH
jgi:hypothetical protein